MKKIISIMLVLFCVVSFSFPAFAAQKEALHKIPQDFQTSRVEQTKWYYRTYNGQVQKRLWSITYLVWLTDWMPN